MAISVLHHLTEHRCHLVQELIKIKVASTKMVRRRKKEKKEKPLRLLLNYLLLLQLPSILYMSTLASSILQGTIPTNKGHILLPTTYFLSLLCVFPRNIWGERRKSFYDNCNLSLRCAYSVFVCLFTLWRRYLVTGPPCQRWMDACKILLDMDMFWVYRESNVYFFSSMHKQKPMNFPR